MNIEEYRQMKQEIEAEDSKTKEQSTDEKAESATTEDETSELEETQEQSSTSQEEEKPNQDGETDEQAQPDVVDIDGQKYTLDQIREFKDSGLRWKDYTQKTQQLTEKERELSKAQTLYENLRQNPEALKRLVEEGVITPPDPQAERLSTMEQELQDLRLDKEINRLKGQYNDFNETEVLQFAYDNQIENVENAYHMLKGRSAQSGSQESQQLDVDSLKEELRQELLKEMKGEESANTQSMINTPSTQKRVRDESPQLSAQEKRVAQHMGMSDKEYAKWAKAK